MIAAEARAGQIWVSLDEPKPGEPPRRWIVWTPDLCQRMADRWEPNGGSWAKDAQTLREALEQYHKQDEAA